MASLNLSQNGAEISRSYESLVQKDLTKSAAASSPTYGQWALYSVQAPLASAFQDTSSKESVLKVQTTGEGELIDLIEDFSDGRIQFAFVKVRDPNSGLPKSVLVAWCGEGVPERTKGYFTSHKNAVSKVLHGYHVEVTARSEQDLTPEGIVQKVADSSGSKYSGGGSSATSASSGPPPPVASKPVMPTKSFGGAGGFQPLGGRTRQAPAQSGPTDDDGWGQDAPQVTRSQLEKVESAYKPTKVDINALQSQKEPSRYQPPQQASNGGSDVVKGGYQPVGKVDINALRAQTQQQSKSQDDRPSVVKGAYEPVGKVDIAEIRRKAQGAPPSQPSPPQSSQDEDERPKSLADRSAAFTSSERMTTLPKPQIANRFGSGASNFAGTKAPAPTPLGGKAPAPAAPVGTASRTFADQGGKTPAQQWEERRRARGMSGAADTQQPQTTGGGTPASPIQSQASGRWQSSYEGKKWGVQIPTRTGGSGVSSQRTGEGEANMPEQQEAPAEQEPEPPAGGVSSIRDRFKGAAPMGAAREGGAPEPPPLDTSSKPNAGAGAARGVPIPGLPQRQEQVPSEEHQDLPPPPPRPMPQDEREEEEEEEQEPMDQGSPARIAMPVARREEPDDDEVEMEKPSPLPPRGLPTSSINDAIAANKEPEPEEQVEDDDPARSAAANMGNAGGMDSHTAQQQGGHEAIAQYDYEKAEENELELREGERITGIDMVDDDWWMGTNGRGESGLFPSNYVELVEGGGASGAAAPPPPPSAPEPEEEEAPAAPARGGAAGGKTATAQYDYEAAEDNEISFPDGATITDVDFPDEDWWSGHYGGKSGLFPANYVTLD